MKAPTKAELYRERDVSSKALLDLIALTESLIKRLKETRYEEANREAQAAEIEIKRIKRGS